MIKVGVFDIVENKTVYTFNAKYVKLHPDFSDNSRYVSFEIDLTKEIKGYYNNNGTIEFDESYITPSDPPEIVVQQVIINSINFGNQTIIDFATENVLMGITQVNKTKEVSDYLSDMTRYIQTGSLYEVINEINRLILAGIPVELSPFVTENRLNEFKQKIQEFLA